MPTYFCHGFRWHRTNIRPFVILNKIEDAAPDWVIGPVTADGILKALHHNFKYIPKPEDLVGEETEKVLSQHLDDKTRNDKLLPPPLVKPEQDSVLRHQWSAVKLLESYDPSRTDEHTRPFAFVADKVIRVELHTDVDEEMIKHGINCVQKDHSWIYTLKDDLQKEEKVSWFIVVCGDEERAFEGKVEAKLGEKDTPEDKDQTATESEDKAKDWVNPEGIWPQKPGGDDEHTNGGGGLEDHSNGNGNGNGNGAETEERKTLGTPNAASTLRRRQPKETDLDERQATRHRRSGSGSGSLEPEERSPAMMSRPSTSRSKSQVAKPSLRKKLSRGEGLRSLFRRKSTDRLNMPSEERPPVPPSRHE